VTITAERETDAVTDTDPDAPDTYDGPRCQSCGGPCWQYKGSVWEYTCTDCIDAYLDEAAARWIVRQAKERAKNERKLLRSNDIESPVSANGRRRDGGGPVVYRTAVPASTTTTDAPR
jgi:hypothetical protein